MEHKRLSDLVYVQYNRKIDSRFQKRRELDNNFDPLVIDDFEWGNEWIDNDADVVHPGEILHGMMWIEQPVHPTRLRVAIFQGVLVLILVII